MPEKLKDNVRKMFIEFKDGIRVNSASGEVVAVDGFIRGQHVRAKTESGAIESDWKITGFDITGDDRKATIAKGKELNLIEEIVSLKKLRELNPEK